jgi:hypothetical protein
MNPDFELVLDDCLVRLEGGASVQDCLALYPEHSEALRPLLALAFEVRAVPPPHPDPAIVAANRKQMLDAIGQKRTRRRPYWLLVGGLLARPVARVLLAVALLMVSVSWGAGGLVTASADSLPGDSLYSVKRLTESLRLALTFDRDARKALRDELVKERQTEVWAVLRSGRAATVDFQGEIEEIGDDFWVVGGLVIGVDAGTRIVGQPAQGESVRVQARSTRNGDLEAESLVVQLGPIRPTPENTVTPVPSPSATPTRPGPATPPAPAVTSTPEPAAGSSELPQPTPAVVGKQDAGAEAEPDEGKDHENDVKSEATHDADLQPTCEPTSVDDRRDPPEPTREAPSSDAEEDHDESTHEAPSFDDEEDHPDSTHDVASFDDERDHPESTHEAPSVESEEDRSESTHHAPSVDAEEARSESTHDAQLKEPYRDHRESIRQLQAASRDHEDRQDRPVPIVMLIRFGD